MCCDPHLHDQIVFPMMIYPHGHVPTCSMRHGASYNSISIQDKSHAPSSTGAMMLSKWLRTKRATKWSRLPKSACSSHPHIPPPHAFHMRHGRRLTIFKVPAQVSHTRPTHNRTQAQQLTSPHPADFPLPPSICHQMASSAFAGSPTDDDAYAYASSGRLPP